LSAREQKDLKASSIWIALTAQSLIASAAFSQDISTSATAAPEVQTDHLHANQVTLDVPRAKAAALEQGEIKFGDLYRTVSALAKKSPTANVPVHENTPGPFAIDIEAIKAKAIRDYNPSPFERRLAYGSDYAGVGRTVCQIRLHNDLLDAQVPEGCIYFEYSSFRSTAIFNISGLDNDTIEVKTGQRTIALKPGHAVIASHFPMITFLKELHIPDRVGYRDIRRSQETDTSEIFEAEFDIDSLIDCNKVFHDTIMRAPKPNVYFSKIKTLTAAQKASGDSFARP